MENKKENKNFLSQLNNHILMITFSYASLSPIIENDLELFLLDGKEIAISRSLDLQKNISRLNRQESDAFSPKTCKIRNIFHAVARSSVQSVVSHVKWPKNPNVCVSLGVCGVESDIFLNLSRKAESSFLF